MSNNTTKVNNPMKVITGKDTRWSYANVWEAKSINGGAPKFSVSLIIPKSDTVTVQKIKAAIEAAYHEGEAKLKGNGKSVPALSVIKNPLRDGDSAVTPFAGRKSRVFREVQSGRLASRRLPKPHERVRHRPPERLDVRKRHPGAGKPRPHPGRGRRRLVPH